MSPEVSDYSKKITLLDNSRKSEHVKHKSSERQARKDQVETKRKEVREQASSFDDFLYMSQHGGGEEPRPVYQQSPKKSLSVSTSELTKRKGCSRENEVEDDIKKV